MSPSLDRSTPLKPKLSRLRSASHFGSRQSSCEEPEMGHEKPGSLGGCGGLEVLGETSASAEPGRCAFDDPASRQKLEAFDAL